MERIEVDQDYVLRRLVAIDQMDIADIFDDRWSLRPISEWPEIWRECISGLDVSELFEGRGDDRKMIGLLKKIKWPDKLKNLELIGKHIKVGAFSDKVELAGKGGGPILHAQISKEELAEAIENVRDKF